MIEVEHTFLKDDGSIDIDGPIVVRVTRSSIAEFKELVHRATNLWPDSSAAIKTFSDEVIHGKVLQNYEDSYKQIKGTHRS